MTTVTCSTCQHFEPDTVGNGTGIGQCAGLIRAKKHLAGKVLAKELSIIQATDKLAEIERECDAVKKLLYPNIERSCKRHAPK